MGVLLGHHPRTQRGGTGNALYWISHPAGKGATRLGLFWAGQHPKRTTQAGRWRGPACPTSSQLLLVHFPVCPHFGAAHGDTAPAAWTQLCTETWAQNSRWEHSLHKQGPNPWGEH